MTNAGKSHKLELRKGAIVCPNCSRPIRGVRLLPGAAVRNETVMCQQCRTILLIHVQEASATYEIARAVISSTEGS